MADSENKNTLRQSCAVYDYSHYEKKPLRILSYRRAKITPALKLASKSQVSGVKSHNMKRQPTSSCQRPLERSSDSRNYSYSRSQQVFDYVQDKFYWQKQLAKSTDDKVTTKGSTIDTDLRTHMAKGCSSAARPNLIITFTNPSEAGSARRNRSEEEEKNYSNSGRQANVANNQKVIFIAESTYSSNYGNKCSLINSDQWRLSSNPSPPETRNVREDVSAPTDERAQSLSYTRRDRYDNNTSRESNPSHNSRRNYESRSNNYRPDYPNSFGRENYRQSSYERSWRGHSKNRSPPRETYKYNSNRQYSRTSTSYRGQNKWPTKNEGRVFRRPLVTDPPQRHDTWRGKRENLNESNKQHSSDKRQVQYNYKRQEPRSGRYGSPRHTSYDERGDGSRSAGSVRHVAEKSNETKQSQENDGDLRRKNGKSDRNKYPALPKQSDAFGFVGKVSDPRNRSKSSIDKTNSYKEDEARAADGEKDNNGGEQKNQSDSADLFVGIIPHSTKSQSSTITSNFRIPLPDKPLPANLGLELNSELLSDDYVAKTSISVVKNGDGSSTQLKDVTAGLHLTTVRECLKKATADKNQNSAANMTSTGLRSPLSGTKEQKLPTSETSKSLSDHQVEKTVPLQEATGSTRGQINTPIVVNQGKLSSERSKNTKDENNTLSKSVETITKVKVNLIQTSVEKPKSKMADGIEKFIQPDPSKLKRSAPTIPPPGETHVISQNTSTMSKSIATTATTPKVSSIQASAEKPKPKTADGIEKFIQPDPSKLKRSVPTIPPPGEIDLISQNTSTMSKSIATTATTPKVSSIQASAEKPKSKMADGIEKFIQPDPSKLKRSVPTIPPPGEIDLISQNTSTMSKSIATTATTPKVSSIQASAEKPKSKMADGIEKFVKPDPPKPKSNPPIPPPREIDLVSQNTTTMSKSIATVTTIDKVNSIQASVEKPKPKPAGGIEIGFVKPDPPKLKRSGPTIPPPGETDVISQSTSAMSKQIATTATKSKVSSIQASVEKPKPKPAGGIEIGFVKPDPPKLKRRGPTIPPPGETDVISQSTSAMSKQIATTATKSKVSSIQASVEKPKPKTADGIEKLVKPDPPKLKRSGPTIPPPGETDLINQNTSAMSKQIATITTKAKVSSIQTSVEKPRPKPAGGIEIGFVKPDPPKLKRRGNPTMAPPYTIDLIRKNISKQLTHKLQIKDQPNKRLKVLDDRVRPEADSSHGGKEFYKKAEVCLGKRKVELEASKITAIDSATIKLSNKDPCPHSSLNHSPVSVLGSVAGSKKTGTDKSTSGQNNDGKIVDGPPVKKARFSCGESKTNARIPEGKRNVEKESCPSAHATSHGQGEVSANSKELTAPGATAFKNKIKNFKVKENWYYEPQCHLTNSSWKKGQRVTFLIQWLKLFLRIYHLHNENSGYFWCITQVLKYRIMQVLKPWFGSGSPSEQNACFIGVIRTMVKEYSMKDWKEIREKCVKVYEDVREFNYSTPIAVEIAHLICPAYYEEIEETVDRLFRGIKKFEENLAKETNENKNK